MALFVPGAVEVRNGVGEAVAHLRSGAAAGERPVLGVRLSIAGETVTVLAHGSRGGWEALVTLLARPRVRRGESAASALGRMLGDGAGSVTVLLGDESGVGEAGDVGSARRVLNGWRHGFDVAIALGPHPTPGSGRLLALARDAGVPAVLVPGRVDASGGVAAATDAEFGEGLLTGAAPPAQPVAGGSTGFPPTTAAATLARAHARDARAATAILDSTEFLARRCRVDPVGHVGWGAAPPPAELDRAVALIASLGIAGRTDAEALAVEHRSVEDAVDAIADGFPDAALLPDGGVVLGGAPAAGRRRGRPLAALSRRDAIDLGYATIAVRPDRTLSALAHARDETGVELPTLADYAREHPAGYTAGVLEHVLEPERSGLLAQSVPVTLLPVSVQRSGADHRVEGTAVRRPLAGAARLTAAEVERILAGRPFGSLADFVARAAPASVRLLQLAAEGALDELAWRATRGEIIAAARELAAGRIAGGAAAGGGTAEALAVPGAGAEPLLFDGLDIPLPPPPPPAHAIETYRAMLDELEVTPAGALAAARPGAEVLVAGVRVPGSRSAQLSVRLEDGSGVAECAFPEAARRSVGSLLSGSRLMLVQGRTRETDDDSVAIEAENAWDLKRMWADWSAAHRRSA